MSEFVTAAAGRAAEPGGPGRVACAAAGTVAELAAAVRDPAFLDACAARYTDAGFGVPGEGEMRSWRRSWPALLAALERAGLGGLRLYLEFGTPGGGRRLDALLVGTATRGGLGLVVVELKQWQRAELLDGGRVLRSDGVVTAHPVYQVAAYRDFFTHWRPEDTPRLDVRACVVLHNATAEEGAALQVKDPSMRDIPVLTGADLEAEPAALAGLLRCEDLTTPAPGDTAAFEAIVWTPSTRLLSQVGQALRGQRTFALVGDQQDAYLRILAAVTRHAEEGGKGAVITVRGGPGSGKTALGVRLLGHLMRRHPDARPRFITPSGTLRAHLIEAAGDQAARELFLAASSMNGASRGAGIVILDEAQRLPHGAASTESDLASLVRQVPLVVVFLDEKQVIRPGEGITVGEIGRLAHRLGRPHHPLELEGSFRCRGSKAFTDWVEDLLYSTPARWAGHDAYDLAVSPDPFTLQDWIEQSNTDGILARTSAGFCWPWTRTARRGALHPDIRISHTHPATGLTRTWTAAWNASETLTAGGDVIAPRSQLWATHTGGHQQIGCVYTAQGIEYQHAGVIIGPDLQWDNGRWTAHPGQSHDPRLRSLTPAQYLPYALNIYRVLLTRGTHATRIHSTHPETQNHLTQLTQH
ncbi:DUF2075 domain-containing protein [Streptomyces sp. NBC_00162]|uniref:DUF2075 domain-containing protein n=1 Tax=Streptomyces sp. NBC_00162 TaxID=2903629 RepID=UPI00214CF243|nr:DUF2075 domain-containing protein [Streptomyces sp. NBC_00162]UUU44334.1 DUF2075 domain-containing protein [Streptomyces sp. NBC_00162]